MQKIISNSKLFKRNPFYKPFNYTWAYEAWNLQQAVHWHPKEVVMSDDLSDYKFKLTEDEKSFLTLIFRFFTQSDIEVNNCYMTYYQDIFEPIEIKMMLSAFSNMETIHVEAYSYLIESLGLPDSEYKKFLDNKEMKDKWNYLQKYGDRSPEGIALTVARFGAFTEGLQLFSAFAVLANFSRFNKMKGMTQIVSWSIRDETLHVESLIRLFHEIIKDHPYIKTDEFERAIIEECKDVIKKEDAFIDYCFEGKQIEGITADSTKKYIRYIANRRLEQLGYNGIYKQKNNPYPWMEVMQNEFTNFFENKPSEYSLYMPKDDMTWEQAFDKVLDLRIQQKNKSAAEAAAIAKKNN